MRGVWRLRSGEAKMSLMLPVEVKPNIADGC